MSKLMRSVLDKVSEDNNAYRDELRNINKQVDERITTLVGEIVTASNYTVDFSSTVSIAKEVLLQPIARVIEVHAIRDLRSVENVNEQFIDKINNKLKKAKFKKPEDKGIFIENLNILLNENYLEIVKIKRVNFINEEGKNIEVEDCFINFAEAVKGNSNFDITKISNVIDNFKSELYDIITKALDNVSNLYLNNFVNEVKNALYVEIEYDAELEEAKVEERFAPYTPEMSAQENQAVDVPVLPEIPNVDVVETEYSQELASQEVVTEEVNAQEMASEANIIPEVPVYDAAAEYSYEVPAVPAYETEVAPDANVIPEALANDAAVEYSYEVPAVPAYEAEVAPDANVIPEALAPDAAVEYSYEVPAVPAYETEVAPNANVIPEALAYDAASQYSYEVPAVPAYETEVAPVANMIPEALAYEVQNEYAPSADYTYDIPVMPAEEVPIAPVETETVKNTYVKPMDVEEILKIAKSPVVTMPVQEEEKEEPKEVENDYTLVSPLEKDFDDDSNIQTEFDEKEIVEEMIRRLYKRLEAINERQAKYEEERARISEDEDFVNGLIKNATAKKEELDGFEAELNNKENSINEKQKELDDKLNEVLPFANALMKAEKEA